MSELYEHTYRRKDRFSFGKNWQAFVTKYDASRLAAAKRSLRSFLGDIKGKTFIDVGCGSGLFSLAAAELGAKSVVSIDADKSSVEAAEHLKQFTKRRSWTIKHGSILDGTFLRSLSSYDIVYSWGVLHHTGDMRKAIRNAAGLVKRGGVFYLAIYNDNRRVLEGTSRFWHNMKRRYNAAGPLGKKLMQSIYTAYLLTGVALHGKSPRAYVRNYRSARGMDFHTDVKDWLGGYPYEYASPEAIEDLLQDFILIKAQKVRSIGCNEFVFRKP